MPPDKRDLFDAVDRVMSGLAESSPLLVLVEDLHWSDAASLECLHVLARRSVARPVALLCTYRGDEVSAELAHFLAELDRARLAVEVPLRRFGPGEIDAMLRAIFGLTHPAPAELIHLLSTLTGGNPFFIEEVLRSLGDSGAGPGTGGRWTLPEVDAVRIPRSVQDAVRRRSARLSPASKRVLELAAVVGTQFDVELVRDVAGLDEVELLAAIKELVAAQLIVEESAARFAFRHALGRQAVYAEILSRERQRLHREVAEALERSSAATDDASISDLAYHFCASATWVKAREYARQAGDHAMALYAPRAAVAHYTRAIEAARRLALPPDPALVRARGSAHELLGEFDRALADYEAARDLARSNGARAVEVEALLSLGLLWAARDYDRAGAAVQAALEVARKVGDDALIARCLNRLGNWHLNTERPTEAQRHHLEALAIVERLDDRRGIAETLDLLGIASFMGGDLQQGTEYNRHAVEVWREVGDRRGLASTLIVLGMRAPTYHTDTLPAVAGHAEAAIEVEEALAVTRDIGWRAGESWALWILNGMILATEGAYGRALDGTRAGLAVAEEIEHRQWMAAAHCMLGNIDADLLDRSRAREHLERALELAREAGASYWERSAAGWLASVAVAQGDLPGAGALLNGALDPASSMETLAPRLLWRSAAELALAEGNAERALAIADQLVATAPNAGTRPVTRLEKLRAEALLALGETGEAETALRRARDTAAELGTRPVLWRTELALGRLWLGQGRDDEARHAFDAAHALVEELAADVPDDELRSGFLTAATALFPAAPARSGRRAGDAAPGGLTSREQEVARLVAAGKSNREIGAALFIADWTAATHVRNILAKLGLSSRTQIAAWAVQHGLAERREPAGAE
jgi:DNA-binding CsgD family transcriptional regulator